MSKIIPFPDLKKCTKCKGKGVVNEKKDHNVDHR